MFEKYFPVALLTLTCLFGSSLTARAQEYKSVVVNIPFEVVAGTNLLPAGRYSVERVSLDSDSALIIHGYDNSASLLPIVFDEVSGGQADVRFEQVGNKHFLREVGVPAGAYSIAISRRMTDSVMGNSDGTSSSAGAH